MANAVFTDVGEAFIIDKLDGTVAATVVPQHIAWGTGAGSASKASTTLFTEASEARVSGTVSQPAADTLRVIGTITANGAKTITNAGLFTAATGGVLFVHVDFTGIPVQLNDQIEFTFEYVQT